MDFCCSPQCFQTNTCSFDIIVITKHKRNKLITIRFNVRKWNTRRDLISFPQKEERKIAFKIMWLTLLIVIFQPQQKKSSPYHYYFSKARYFPDFAFTLQPQLVLFFPFNKINIKMKRYNNYEK